MWKLHNGKLVQTTDETRVRYKTRISAEILNNLKQLAETYDTHIGYLLENGYSNLIETGAIVFNKQNRPKDRTEFRTTCDKELLESLKNFAKKHELNLNDVIEASVSYINFEDIKHSHWRYRVEI